MLDNDKGFYVVKGYNTLGRYYAIDLKPTYLGMATFTEVRGPEPVDLTWDFLKEYLETPFRSFNASGMPDERYAGQVVSGMPLAGGKNVRYGGRVYLHLDGMNGLDELSDYSLIDMATDPNGKILPWQNRLAHSSQEKVHTSFRHRARRPQQIGAVVFWPLKVDDLTQTRVEVVTGPEGVVLLNDTKTTGEIDGPKVIPNDGKWYEQFYFSAVTDQTVKVPAGESVEVAVQLHWNKPGVPFCTAAVDLKIEEVSGYVPRKRVRTNENGFATVKVHALGLEPGEKVVAKLRTDHFSSVGKIEVEVV